ncbi:MAG: M48 family metallopeptidase [Thermoplasmatales archaeon]
MERSDFLMEVETFANRIGVKPKEIQLRVMKRKWGSCSSSGRVTFNERLLSENESIIREVIVHELLHLRYRRHSKMFKRLMKLYTEQP